jgi:hypothetical protein
MCAATVADAGGEQALNLLSLGLLPAAQWERWKTRRGTDPKDRREASKHYDYVLADARRDNALD